jgi:predicted nucleotidyltransferase
MRKLRRCARDLVSERPEVKRVLLFGSIARGEDGPRSDADIVVIVSRSRHKRIFDRTHIFSPYFSPARIPVDVLAYTEAEVERMRADDNPFMRRVLSEGVELASAA